MKGSRTGHKVAEGHIVRVEKEVYPKEENLKPYQRLSSFRSWTEWERAIGRVNGWQEFEGRHYPPRARSKVDIFIVSLTHLECYSCWKEKRPDHSPVHTSDYTPGDQPEWADEEKLSEIGARRKPDDVEG